MAGGDPKARRALPRGRRAWRGGRPDRAARGGGLLRPEPDCVVSNTVEENDYALAQIQQVLKGDLTGVGLKPSLVLQIEPDHLACRWVGAAVGDVHGSVGTDRHRCRVGQPGHHHFLRAGGVPPTHPTLMVTL